MGILDAMLEGDVFIDFPYERVKFRYEKETGKIYRRFYGKTEEEIPPSSHLYNQAILEGDQITREEYFFD